MQPKVSEFSAQLPAYFNVCVFLAQPASFLSFYLFIFLDYLF